jgi:SecD/SecF fusion protein
MAWYSNLAWIIAQAAPAAEAAPADDNMSGTLRLIAALAVVIGSFVVGGIIARALRMPDYGFKISLVIFALVAGLAINYFGWPPKRGIDLSGGVVLVYEVDTGLSSSNWMQSAILRINQQLNAEGGEKLEARPVGDDQIEIVVPDGVDVARIEAKIASLRDAADIMLHAESRRSEDGKTVLRYRADPAKQRVLDMSKLIAAVGRRINPGGVKELTIRQYGSEQLEVIIPEVEEREVEQIKKKISTSGLLEFRIVANQTDDKDIIKVAQRTAGRDVYIGGRLVGRWVKAGPELPQTLPPPEATYRQSPGDGLEILVRIDPFNVDGRYLTRAGQGFDDRGGMAVDFSFDTVGAEKFRQLTNRNLPDAATNFYRHLGIILDNTMLSAPRLITTISNRGQITGGFSEDYVNVLVGVLNAGSLPATLRPEPISQQRISAQLGDDTIRAGANAMAISTAAILLFMLIYYRFAGVVADIAVTLNIVITVALMILIKAAFTLPGLAGLVLTVGMAVDANVLIYERIREESARGASLRMAIRNGFSRAMGTIIDANVTTLITAIVLYVIGTDQIKGFAVTLILGLLVSMFTAIFVARVIFDIAERKRWITRLKMMQIVGHTDFDFIRWRTPAIAASVIVIAIGLAAAVLRGKELLDIDFTGGSSVQLVFSEGKQHSISEVRDAVAELPDVAVSSVGERGMEFKIDTSDNDIQHVKSILQQTFRDALKTYSMTFGELAMIEAKADDSKQPAEPAAPADKNPDEDKPANTAAPTSETKTPNEAEGKPTPDAAKEGNSKGEAPKNEKQDGTKAPPSSGAASTKHRAIDVASTEDSLGVLALAQDAAQTAAPPAAADKTASPDEAQPQDVPAAKQNQDVPKKSDEKAPAVKSDKPAADEPQAAKPAQPSTQSGGDVAALPGSMVGGTRVELTFPEEIAHEPLQELIQGELNAMDLRELSFQLQNPSYQTGSEARYGKWTLQTTLNPKQTRVLLDKIQRKLASTPVFPSSSEIGGKVAGDTKLMALYAMLASMLMIVIYVWIRFQNVYFGFAAVLALVHDVLVAVAFLGISAYLSTYLDFLLIDPFKISLAVVAALLTIVGFSINDTIVIFDRIREVRGKSPELTPEMINLSVNQTLSRTLLTSGTVLISTIILYIVGGQGIHAFAFTMLVGVIAGTYSSVYIAAPVLLWLRRPARKTVQPTAAIPTAAARGN